jgi:hypothetical protein
VNTEPKRRESAKGASASAKKTLAGKWQITKMSDFAQKDVDMETKAFMVVQTGGSGSFQFILVEGEACGEFSQTHEGSLFDFTWQGNDECDEASGDGWIRSIDGKSAEGSIWFHCGDTHRFQAKKIMPSNKDGKK